MKCKRDLSKKKKMIKNTSSKIKTNSKLSTSEPKTKTKQTGTGTASQKWRSHGRLSAGRREREEWGEKVQGISIKGRFKIDGGTLRSI